MVIVEYQRHHGLLFTMVIMFISNLILLFVLGKAQKSKLQQKLTMTVIPEPNLYTSIIDMGLIWRLTTPTIEDREKGDGTKYTWGAYAEKLVQFVLRRHARAQRIICVNDSYDQNYTIKDSERILQQKDLPVSKKNSKISN